MDAAAEYAAALEMPALSAHLRQCDGCRGRLLKERQLFASIDAGLAASVAAQPSPHFAQRVMEQVTGEAERKLLAAIDAGLAQSVASEPPPQFAAAVRQRIAAEPAPGTARFWSWWIPAAGALAAVVVLAVMLRRERPPVNIADTAPKANSVVVTDSGAGLAPHSANPAPGKSHTRASVGAAALQSAAAVPVDAPVVLIPAEERQTVTQFYRFVQEGRINTEQVLQANRMELAAKLVELQTPLLVARSSQLKTLDLVGTVRSTSDEK